MLPPAPPFRTLDGWLAASWANSNGGSGGRRLRQANRRIVPCEVRRNSWNGRQIATGTKIRAEMGHSPEQLNHKNSVLLSLLAPGDQTFHGQEDFPCLSK